MVDNTHENIYKQCQPEVHKVQFREVGFLASELVRQAGISKMTLTLTLRSLA